MYIICMHCNIHKWYMIFYHIINHKFIVNYSHIYILITFNDSINKKRASLENEDHKVQSNIFYLDSRSSNEIKILQPTPLQRRMKKEISRRYSVTFNDTSFYGSRLFPIRFQYFVFNVLDQLRVRAPKESLLLQVGGS